MQIGFSYGCLSDPLEKQAKKQGFTLGEKAKKMEHLKDCVIKLRFGIDIPDGIYDKLLKKLNKTVIGSLIALKKG